MGRDDWYRRATWGENEEKAFFSRLARSRDPFHKAEYLRIQAWYLMESGHPAPALKLIKMAITDFPDETQQTSLFLQKAQCLFGLGDPLASFEAYLAALKSQRENPNVICMVALSFAEDFWGTANASQTRMLVGELQEEIERFGLLEPWMKVRYGIAMARLMERQGDRESAAQAARVALECVADAQDFSVDDETRLWLEELQ